MYNGHLYICHIYKIIMSRFNTKVLPKIKRFLWECRELQRGLTLPVGAYLKYYSLGNAGIVDSALDLAYCPYLKHGPPQENAQTILSSPTTERRM